MIKKIGCFYIIITMLFASSSSALIDSKDIKASIIEASAALFDSSTTKETIVNSLIQLLDVVVILTSTSIYKDEIKYHIDVVEDLIKNESLFNEKARQYLSFAYRMVTNGQKYQKPKELDEFVTPSEAQEKAMKYAKGLIEKALTELKSDHKEKTAKHLLELVLMIITPTSG